MSSVFRLLYKLYTYVRISSVSVKKKKISVWKIIPYLFDIEAGTRVERPFGPIICVRLEHRTRTPFD